MSKKNYFFFLLLIFLIGVLTGVLILQRIIGKETKQEIKYVEPIIEYIELTEEEIYIFCHKVQNGIEVDLSRQKLRLCEEGKAIEQFQISSGKIETPTPVGEFRVIHKAPMIFSRIANAWLPFWVGFTPDGLFGFHELPIDVETAKRVGEDKIGQSASLGCIRLKVNDAERLYHWTETGDKVVIFGQIP